MLVKSQHDRDNWRLRLAGDSQLALRQQLCRGVVAGRAFTMIELLVVIGVVMVVLGLVLPSIGSSWEQARVTADLATVRGNTALIMQYANEHDDAYPVGGPNRCSAGTNWHQPLVDGGYLPGMGAADPHSYARWGRVTFLMSECLAADPLDFTPGYTRRCEDAPSVPIGQYLVPFPDRKGLMLKNFEREGRPNSRGAPGDRYFCCVTPWEVPVGFCDGSGVLASFLNFTNGQRPLVDEFRVGVPVLRSWGGYAARDR
jgi:hypothetical protein